MRILDACNRIANGCSIQSLFLSATGHRFGMAATVLLELIKQRLRVCGRCRTISCALPSPVYRVQAFTASLLSSGVNALLAWHSSLLCLSVVSSSVFSVQ